MLLVCGLGLVVFLVVFYLCVKNDWDWGEAFPPAALSGLTGAMISFFIAVMVGIFVPTHFELEEQLELVSASDGSSIEGHFFLGSGYVGDRQVYSYRYQLDDGGLIWDQVQNSPEVVVYEEEREDAVLLIYVTVPDDERWYLVAVLVDSYRKYEFHVPKGSVLTGYVFDEQ